MAFNLNLLRTGPATAAVDPGRYSEDHASLHMQEAATRILATTALVWIAEGVAHSRVIGEWNRSAVSRVLQDPPKALNLNWLNSYGLPAAQHVVGFGWAV